MGRPPTKYSEEQKQFILKNMEEYNFQEIARMFNLKFKNKQVSSKALAGWASHNGYKLNVKVVSCCSGNKLHNRALAKRPLGSESRNTNGFVIVKTSDEKLCRGSSWKLWKLKKVFVWEQEHKQQLPEKWCVLCLDEDEDNFSPENLYACHISVAKSFYGLKRYYPNIVKNCGVEWVKTYLLWAELKRLLRKKGVNKNQLFLGRLFYERKTDFNGGTGAKRP